MNQQEPQKSDDDPGSGSAVLMRTVLFMIVLPAALVWLIKVLIG